jgi:hypothetical protein
MSRAMDIVVTGDVVVVIPMRHVAAGMPIQMRRVVPHGRTPNVVAMVSVMAGMRPTRNAIPIVRVTVVMVMRRLTGLRRGA